MSNSSGGRSNRCGVDPGLRLAFGSFGTNVVTGEAGIFNFDRRGEAHFARRVLMLKRRVEDSLTSPAAKESGSRFESSNDERDILAAESEAVRQRDVDRGFTSSMRDIIEIAVGIGIVEIDRRRSDTVAYRQQADDRLDAPRGRDQMTHHALGARDRNPIRLLAEGSLDRQRFD